MNNRGPLFLSGVVSAGIHAYIAIAAGPWIDPPRLEPSVRKPLQVTLTTVRVSTPEPQAEDHSDPESVAPGKDESADPPERAAKTVPDRNTALGKSRVAAPKVRKSRKAPRRTAAKPTSRKQKERKKRKTKRSAKVRSNKRNRAHGKRLAGTKARKPSASRSAKARPRPKAASNRVRKPTPNYRSNPRPGYPRIARRRGLEGTVILKARVNPQGRVGECRIHKSSGHRILDQRAMKTVRKWTFEPGRKGAKPLAMWVKIPIRFELK